MSVLYTLSNILIPFSLMIFETIKRSSDGLKPSYGKWLALFTLTFLFNGISFFGKWWILLIDLALKCSLYFLPEQINERIQVQISRLHLQSLIQNFRNTLVNISFTVNQKFTSFVLGRLRPEEAEQFKEALIKSLNNQVKDLTAGVTTLPKQFESTGVNCTIISQNLVEKSLIKRELQQKKNDIQKRVSPDSKRSNSSNSKMKPQKEISEKPQSSKQYGTKQDKMHQSQAARYGPTNDFLGESFNELRQSSNIIAADFEEEEQEIIKGRQRQKQKQKQKIPVRFSRHMDPQAAQQKQIGEKLKVSPKQFQKKIPQKKVLQKKLGQKKQQAKKQVVKEVKDKKMQGQRQNGLKRRNTDISQIKHAKVDITRQRSVSPDLKQVVQQAKILQKLDVSVSEYSDMFQEDRDEEMEGEDNGEVKQTCRVEAIVQIGAPPHSKLQIYYLQLYSNAQLKIMSLYGRQFERHKLISVTKGQNNYFELHLSEGTVNKRKVKFRGQYQPFIKYLQNI